MKVTEKYKATFWGVACAVAAVWVCLIAFGPLHYLVHTDYMGVGLVAAAFAGWLACTIQAGIDSEKE